ncbi:MAG TPA: hypothetical protein VNF73_10765 [Candidatus Saccharimonadales bacterium]|nr:hypothetical protein [Candidatus Saccharimonadales bacterium]
MCCLGTSVFPDSWATEGTHDAAFDPNVERVLEHWTVAHAFRELIANALDESALTRTPPPRSNS